MQKVSVEKIKNHLNGILSKKTDQEIFEAIRLFQGWMWDENYDLTNSEAEVLNDLALDLEYFNPNETAPEFYGRPKLYSEIQSVIAKL